MPKLEPKQIQRELDQGKLRPVYWLSGGELMKARELLKRVRKAVLPAEGAGGLLGMAEETFDGGQASAEQIMDAALSPALGGGTRLIIVREAHALKDPEALERLLEGAEPRAREELTSVCVFVGRDLDARRKFSKTLLEKAAVVPCEEVTEAERPAWIAYLAKRRGIELKPTLAAELATLDPWSLDIVDNELEKLELAGGEGALLAGAAITGGADAFLEAFFTRNLAEALRRSEAFADAPEESLPLLGLLAWNVRHFAIYLADRERGTREFRGSPYIAQKFQGWARRWTLAEVLELQRRLAELDFGMKQTPLLPLGLWTKLVTWAGKA